MDIKLVKELRDRTGAGFLDCQKALAEANGDVEKAIEILQEKGAAKAAKKAGAIAAEGVVMTMANETSVVLFELNAQTDFVAKNKEFQDLYTLVGNTLLANDFSNIEEALQAKTEDGKTIEELTVNATATIGEKINLRRAEKFSKEGKVIGAYTHVNKRVAAVVVAEGGTEEAVRNVAMHVASMNPQFLDESSVPADRVAMIKEEIAQSPALQGKPENIVENIAKGMLRKQLSELTLVDQEFVMEKMPVSKYLADNGAKAIAMSRYEVGEGIEKKQEDFAAEVAAQMTA